MLGVNSDTFHVTADEHGVIDLYLNNLGHVLNVFINTSSFIDRNSGAKLTFTPRAYDITELVCDIETGVAKFDLPLIWERIAPPGYNINNLDMSITLIWVTCPKTNYLTYSRNRKP